MAFAKKLIDTQAYRADHANPALANGGVNAISS